MTEPTTPAGARRTGLNRARWIATGAAVGSAVVLTGTIAVVNAAPSSHSNTPLVRSDDGISDGISDGIDDDEYVPAQPFEPQPQTQQPQTQPPTQQVPLQPGTRSGGS